MKKFNSFFAGLLFLGLSLNTIAQSQPPADYFVGKWNLSIEGLPQGDTKMMVSLERSDAKLTGAVFDSTQKEIAKFSKVEEKDNGITVYFSAQGYEVYLRLEKNGDDKVKGTMMDMFDATGERVKETKKSLKTTN